MKTSKFNKKKVLAIIQKNEHLIFIKILLLVSLIEFILGPKITPISELNNYIVFFFSIFHISFNLIYIKI